MFTIKFRRKGGLFRRKKRSGSSKSCGTIQDTTASQLPNYAGELNLSVECFVDDDDNLHDVTVVPNLLEDSFASSSSSEGDESSLASCSLESSTSSRRVTFLLPPEKSKTAPKLIARSSAYSSQSLLQGDIPLAKPKLMDNTTFDVSSASVPGNKIWLVGRIPEIPQEEEEDSSETEDALEDILFQEEEVPFDEVQPQEPMPVPISGEPETKQQRACAIDAPFDEQRDCCTETSLSPSSCTICQNIQVYEASPGRWHVNSNDTHFTITLPPSTTLKTSLKRDIVIDSDLSQDLCVYVDENDATKGWNVESFLFVLVQLVLLKVSASI